MTVRWQAGLPWLAAVNFQFLERHNLQRSLITGRPPVCGAMSASLAPSRSRARRTLACLACTGNTAPRTGTNAHVRASTAWGKVDYNIRAVGRADLLAGLVVACFRLAHGQLPL
jgi:hypothetical protein